MLNRYVGPLDLNTVLELPYWTDRKQPDETLRANVDVCLKELSLHGIEVWNEWYPTIQANCRRVGITVMADWEMTLRLCANYVPPYMDK